MDITSMLNRSSAPKSEQKAEGQTPPSVVEGGITASSSVLSTPSPDWHSSQPEEDDYTAFKSRRPWDAGGYSLPLHVESKYSSDDGQAFQTPTDQMNITPPYDDGSSSISHFRNGSMDSDCIEMTDSDVIGPLRSHRSNRSTCSSLFADMSVESPGEKSAYGYQRPQKLDSYKSNQWLDHSTNAISRPQDSRHKLSDSRSSFSSYTSSSFSTCHSRFSSMSTVSGVHSAGSAITEMPPTDTKFSHFQDTITVPTLVNVQPPSPRTLPSPVEDSSRPCLGLQPRSSAYAISKTMTIPENSSIAHLSKNHKRAISAPDFADKFSNLPAITSEHFAPTFPSYPNMARSPRQDRLRKRQAARTRSFDNPALHMSRASEPTAAYTAHGRSLSSTLGHAADVPSFSAPILQQAGLAHLSNPESDEPMSSSDVGAANQKCVCMFVENCDTNSQLRKAISHFFGRNKSCIRCIPEWVWVHYCRKHYQRGRYRNGGKYPLTQMVLVKLQIERMEAWSSNNKDSGDGPYIESWTIAIRKREQNRLDSQAAGTQNASNASSTVPHWVFEHLGPGHPVAQILQIVDRIHDDIESGVLTQVPDIEFLPEIVNVATTSSPSKTVKAPKRKTFPGNDDSPSTRQQSGNQHRSSPVSYHESETSTNYLQSQPGHGFPSDKRQRLVQPTASEHESLASSSSSNELRRSTPVIPRMQFREARLSTSDNDSKHEASIGSCNTYGAARQDVGGRLRTHSIVESRRLPPITALQNSHPSTSWSQSSYSQMKPSSGFGNPHSSRMARSAHNRTISDFQPMNRAMPDVGRPSSSGDGVPTASMFHSMNATPSFESASSSAAQRYQPFSPIQQEDELVSGRSRFPITTPRLAPLRGTPANFGPTPSTSTPNLGHSVASRLPQEWRQTKEPYNMEVPQHRQRPGAFASMDSGQRPGSGSDTA